MKIKQNLTCVFVLLSFFSLLFTGCPVWLEENEAPNCKINYPINNDTIDQGDSIVISASASDTDGQVMAVGFNIDGTDVTSVKSPPYNYTWNTSNEEIGSHTIKTTAEDNIGRTTSDEISIVLKIKFIAVSSIIVSGQGGSTSINADNGTLQMNATISPSDATDKSVSWSVIPGTGDATINSNGLLKAVSNGTVTVRASATDGSGVYGEKQFSITNQLTLITSISVTGQGGTTEIITYNGTLQMIASVSPSDATDKSVTWSVIPGTGDATISSNGLLKAVSNGTVTVRATANDGSGVQGNLVITISMSYGKVYDVDGNIYKTVTIGTQVWMAENLKTTRLRDRTAIPEVRNNGSWDSSTKPAYCWYNNDEASNHYPYGALYNWYTVNKEDLCPYGWHVPSEKEWRILTDFLGGTDIAGGKLKETGTEHWNSPNIGATNESGFTALPGGFREGKNGHFIYIGSTGVWWSSSSYSYTEGWYTALTNDKSIIVRYHDIKKFGFSVRCVKD